MKKAYLHIITWKDNLIVWYAEHYYGTLRFGDKSISVRCKLTEVEAKRFNKADPSALRKYKPGDRSDRFTDKEKLVRLAIKLFEKDNYGYELLIKGDNCCCDPQKILVGPSEIKVRANELFDRLQENGDWEWDNEPEMRKLYKEWESLVGPVWEK